MLFGERHVSIPFENEAYIATFIIPKGATYIINAQGEVVSDKIIYTGKYIKIQPDKKYDTRKLWKEK